MSDMRRLMMMFTRPIEVALPPPTISPSGGNISSSYPISINVSGTAVGAEYSFDCETWISYSAPFTLGIHTAVYARAIDGNGEYSSISRASYTIIPYDAEVEYLQSSTTQWIDTGIVPDFNTTVEEKIAILTNADSSTASARTGTDSANRFFAFSWGGSGYARFVLGEDQYRFGYTFGDTPHIIVFNEQETHSCYYDNLLKKTFTTGNVVDADNNLLLFSTSGYDNPAINPVRIYYCKIIKNGVLVRDFIPVRVGTVGYMYDKVSETLFSNSGTDNFTFGNDI